MEEVRHTQVALQELCDSIQSFIREPCHDALYTSPIIDYHHPDDYKQRGVQGIRRFLSQAESERDYVTSLVESATPPNDFTTNAPHLLAVWKEFTRAKPPLCLISQNIECGSGGTVKIDVVADGGNEWIKVNTIKEARLMAEFREQDSYINSDYDSIDSEDEETPDSIAFASRDQCRSCSLTLSNSIIAQVGTLIEATKAYPRPSGLPIPRLTYVLSRLEEQPEDGYEDPRVAATFAAVREVGAKLVFQQSSGHPETQELPLRSRVTQRAFEPFRPRKLILLDLSVVIALCCDSTHQPLPTSDDELEARFRPLRRSSSDGTLSLEPHTPVSSDLRDQLRWEVQHPLIEEMQERLAHQGSDIEFWVTPEAKEKVPGIVDVIGGPLEKARAKALFDETRSFWTGSRYDSREGVLKDLHVRVWNDSQNENGHTLAASSLELNELSPFERCLISTCQMMLMLQDPSIPRTASPTPPEPNARKSKGRPARNPRRPLTAFPPTRLPSAHTLRTLVCGVENRMTVLTNNRGAVGKVIREMGILEGMPHDVVERRGEAIVWIVNPSSLAEWRRREVDNLNERVRAEPSGD